MKKKICLKTVSDTLSNSEMKQVTGGNNPCGYFSCSCTIGKPPFATSWSGYYCSTLELVTDVDTRCISGGCKAAALAPLATR